MKGSTKLWLRGAAAALISGAAGGVPTTFAATSLDPQAFNFSDQLGKTMALLGFAVLMSGISGVSAYLKQSPLPAPKPKVAA